MKTIQELEKEKLQEEINLLRARIINEFPEDKPDSSWDKLSDFFRKWYSFILALFAVFGGFWGIFYPVKTFLNEQQKAVQYTINENMINAMEDLETGGKVARENSIIILTYYDLNAIPILLDKYMEQELDSIDMKQDYIEAISVIYSRNQSGIIDRIIIKIRKNYNLFKEYTIKQDWRAFRHTKHLINLIDLIESLDVTSNDRDKVKKFYADIVDDLEENKAFQEKDGVSILDAKMKGFISDGN